MKEILIFVFGCLVGIILMAYMMFTYNTYITSITDAVYECEQNIPRNQHCDYEVIATPIEQAEATDE